MKGNVGMIWFCVVWYFANGSNVAAGKLFGIPLRGTHSHAYVSSFMVSSLQPKVSIFMLERLYNLAVYCQAHYNTYLS